MEVGTEAGRTKLSIHRVLKRHLIQKAADQGDQQLNLVFQRAVAMVRRAFPAADELQIPTSETAVECEQCLSHILSLTEIYRDWAPRTKPTFDFASLLADTGTNYMWERGLSVDAIAVLDMGDRVCDELSGLEDINPIHADICAIAASVYETIGITGRQTSLDRCEKALQLRQERIDLLEARGETIPKAMFLQLANAWNDVGCGKLALGDGVGALPDFLESQRLKEAHATEDELPWHFGELYKNLALVNLYLGDLRGAAESVRRSCELCSRGRTEKDAATQKARSVMGIVLVNIPDEMDEALRLHKGVYKVRKEIFGEANPHTRNSLYLVGELHRLKGKLEKAE